MIKIKSIKLSVICMPLKYPFTTHLETVKDREGIIVEVRDENGLKGYGEVVAFSTPWYTEETIKTCYHMLKDFLIPLLKDKSFTHPDEVSGWLDKYRRNHMAKAGIETAIWDLYAKQNSLPLSKLLGGMRTKIPSGVVVAGQGLNETLTQIENYLANGYQRVKVKISPEKDIELISDIRKHFPRLQLMADANSAYSLSDIDRLKALDDFGLLMIEQPLEHDDIVDHARLQRHIKTPICLDESIVTFDDARRAIELGSCKVINIKIGRVGGLGVAKKIHDYCSSMNIQVWCGGMLEFGISRAHNIALASLPGFTIPGDISASDRYWEEDITTPKVVVKNGYISVPDVPGIGFEINERKIKDVLISEEILLL